MQATTTIPELLAKHNLCINKFNKLVETRNVDILISEVLYWEILHSLNIEQLDELKVKFALKIYKKYSCQCNLSTLSKVVNEYLLDGTCINSAACCRIDNCVSRGHYVCFEQYKIAYASQFCKFEYLHDACITGNMNFLQKMNTSVHGFSLVRVAIENNRICVLKHLIETCIFSVSDQIMSEWFASAKQRNALDCLEFLCKKFSTRVKIRSSWLLLACANGHIGLVKLICTSGVKLRDNFTTTAAEYNRLQVLQYLLSVNCPIDFPSCLRIAATNNCSDIFDFLSVNFLFC